MPSYLFATTNVWSWAPDFSASMSVSIESFVATLAPAASQSFVLLKLGARTTTPDRRLELRAPKFATMVLRSRESSISDGVKAKSANEERVIGNRRRHEYPGLGVGEGAELVQGRQVWSDLDRLTRHKAVASPKSVPEQRPCELDGVAVLVLRQKSDDFSLAVDPTPIRHRKKDVVGCVSDLSESTGALFCELSCEEVQDGRVRCLVLVPLQPDRGCRSDDIDASVGVIQ